MTNSNPTVVVVVRPPDSSNESTVFGDANVRVVDVDLGYADLRDEEEFLEWAVGQLETADNLEQIGRSDAADMIREIVLTQAEDHNLTTIESIRTAANGLA